MKVIQKLRPSMIYDVWIIHYHPCCYLHVPACTVLFEPCHEKTVYAICKQQRHRSACASMQSDQKCRRQVFSWHGSLYITYFPAYYVVHMDWLQANKVCRYYVPSLGRYCRSDDIVNLHHGNTCGNDLEGDTASTIIQRKYLECEFLFLETKFWHRKGVCQWKTVFYNHCQ